MPPGDEAPFELGTDGPRSILVGVDGSTASQRAGWYACLARRQRASVTAVYVAPMSARLAVPAAVGAEAAPREADEQTAEDMRRRAEEFPGSSASPSPSGPSGATRSPSCAGSLTRSAPTRSWWGRPPMRGTGWSARWRCGW